MKVEELINFQFPKAAVGVLSEHGIRFLFEPQELAVNMGVQELKKSFLISVPTASGKTLIAELMMVNLLLKSKKSGKEHPKCLYIVPLKALATEKYHSFLKWENLGISVGISTGDLDSDDPWLSKNDIIIATSEKVDSLTRHSPGWMKDIALLVVDEVHLVHDSRRGPTLEVVVARIRHLIPNLLILALSATVANPGEIAEWLDAVLVESNWRPVELKEGVYFNRSILFNDSSVSEVRKGGRSLKDIASNLAVDALKSGGQSLVFINTRRSAESLADGVDLTKDLTIDETTELDELADKALKALRDPTKTCQRLAKCIRRGVAFHHAGLLSKQRSIVEEGFKSRKIKIVSATPTLAAGVNLPARRVIIKDYQRYDSNVGRIEIPVLEYKQMAGRAGRPGFDDYGEAVLLARTEGEKDFLLDNFVLSEPEEICSKLSMESAIRNHVLSTIASNFANTDYALLDFFSKTLFAIQRDINDLEIVLDRVIDFLRQEEMIYLKAGKQDFYHATAFGRRTSQLYIDPLSAAALRDCLNEAMIKTTSPISYLHAISRTSELGSLYLRKGEAQKFEAAAFEALPYMLTSFSDDLSPWDRELIFSEMKMASFLLDWINEFGEEKIREKYNIAAGDIRNKVEISKWMLYSMKEIGKLFRFPKIGELSILQHRMEYGVKTELLELVSLKGIGRIRGRMLYNRGFKTLGDLKKSSVRDLSSIETIGEKLAESILEQTKAK